MQRAGAEGSYRGRDRKQVVRAGTEGRYLGQVQKASIECRY